ncbi:MAG: hypothetical protein JWL77_2303 [Chthonomonadaceae bacterium]|nr:hypothetical protein [Chthonomonadaceae bacterium]
MAQRRTLGYAPIQESPIQMRFILTASSRKHAPQNRQTSPSACLLLTLLCGFLAASALSRASGKSRTVSLQSLLAELTDVESVARWPQPEFICSEASSYDRSRSAPDKPGWFANNDSSQFVRVEERAGRREQVMLDTAGPGAIVRFWLTSNEKRAGTLRVYLEGSEQPVLSFGSYDLMFSGLVASPLLHPHPSYNPTGIGGSTLYLPIPYARHCKVTWEEADPAHAGPRYYQINYRTYAPGTRVQTFTLRGLEAAQADVIRTNASLLHPAMPSGGDTRALNTTIAAGGEETLALPEGARAVRQLEMQFTPDAGAQSTDETQREWAWEQALRGMIVRMRFDGEETVWSPVSDFAGSGVGTRPLQSWYRTVDEAGKMTCRWVMPYARSGQITLTNLGASPIRVQMKAVVSKWQWDERSMHFHASWRQQAQVPTKPDSDWDFLGVKGKGVLVGDVLAVFNPVPAWYGEGDEKIWVDGEAFPSHLGTGTEDYYNASWAPTPVYQTPFANGPRVDESRSQGHNTYTRTRNLDAIPFRSSLQFDMEIEHWQDPQIDIAATTYWYAFPQAGTNRTPLPEEARRPLSQVPPPFRIAHAVECETCTVTAHSDGLGVEVQDTHPFPGQWSSNAHLLGKGRKPGDFVELRIPAPAGSHRLTLYATKAGDYGIVRLWINGQQIANDFNGYAPNVTPSGPIPLGTFAAQDGQYTLRVEVVGADPKAGGAKYLFGLDCIAVTHHMTFFKEK